MARRIVGAAAVVAGASAKSYMSEGFAPGWEKKWTVGSEWKPAAEMGEFKWTSGEHHLDASDKGIQTSQDARFYSITAPLDAPLSNEGGDLVLSYGVKMESAIDCGGAYIKLLPPGYDAKKFGGDTPYAIMFGPDICGTSTRKTHVIVTRGGKNHLVKKNVKVETDKLTHRYTLAIHKDNSYEVFIDGSKVESGNLADDFDGLLPPPTIKDPAAKKPADWVDAATIPDPADVKPAGYDDVPAKIPDPAAKKPEDWDDEEDGSWEAPTIDNPAFKGTWSPKMIPNPEYKGVWVHPDVPNPDYAPVPNLHAFCAPCTAVGFELWQVKSGTLFDDIYVGDSLEEATAFAETLKAKAAGEKASLEAAEKKAADEAAAARAKADEEAKAAAAAKADDKPAGDAEEDEDDGEL